MKLFNESIKKTIKNFNEIASSEFEMKQILEYHYDQIISQEEMWTFKQTKTNMNLWNKLIELVENSKYSYLVEE